MAGITLANAETQLAYWLDADYKLSLGETVSMQGESVTRADTQAKIEFWDKQVKRLSRGGIRISGGTPC